MPIINHLVGRGVPTGVAGVVVGGVGDTVYTAAGASKGAATLLGSGTNYVSIVSSSGKGVQLPACDPCSSVFVWNGGANTLNLYGQTGESIGAGAANGSFALASKKGVLCTKLSGTVWGQILSA